MAERVRWFGQSAALDTTVAGLPRPELVADEHAREGETVVVVPAAPSA